MFARQFFELSSCEQPDVGQTQKNTNGSRIGENATTARQRKGKGSTEGRSASVLFVSFIVSFTAMINCGWSKSVAQTTKFEYGHKCSPTLMTQAM